VVAEEVIAHRPQVVAGARANRAFLARAIRFLVAECGIRQFLDIGTGLPAPENTHELAQAIAPDCRIVYVDHDPLVLVHARALLTSTRQGSCDYLETDLRDPPTILAGAAETLDLTRPAAVLLLAVLHFITDTDGPAAIVAALAQQLAPGSFVVISHLTGDFAPGPVLAGVEAYNTLVPTTLVPRTHSQVSALFGPTRGGPSYRVAARPCRAVPRVCRHVRRNRPHSDKSAKDNHLSHDHDSGAYAHAATIGAS
jgi:SAM-dependent methyltransferase